MNRKIYAYVNTSRANFDGSHSVFLIISGTRGKFLVNTGLTASGKLTDGVFPKADSNWKKKTALLGKYLADAEAICLEAQLLPIGDAELKERIQREVFSKTPTRVANTLADVILKFAATKKEHTRQIYVITADKVRQFDSKASLSIDEEWLESFRQHYLDEGMKVNGVGKELRNIRAVFNWARRKDLTRNYPFLDYHIVQEETVPNNILVEDLRRLRDYPCETWQKPYVDFFMLSFYLAGINPVDLLSLKRDALKNGHITFVRTKTNKQGAKTIRTITLPVLPEAQEIIDRYPSREGWLTGFRDCRNSYRSFSHACNEALQKVGPKQKVKDKVGKLRKIEYSPVCPGITLYSARYSFGSIAANDLDISERTIGMCLGHAWSKNVTCRYMAHDQRKVDEAIRKVIKYVSTNQK